MKAIITESGLTDRIKRIQLAADTFEEERLLKLLIDGLATGGALRTEPRRRAVRHLYFRQLPAGGRWRGRTRRKRGARWIAITRGEFLDLPGHHH